MKTRRLLTTTYILSLILALPCRSETVGKVFQMKGDAVCFTEAKPQETKLAQNAPVQSKDILRTAANGNIEIGFLDATSCKMGPSTELSIEEYRFVRNQQNATFKANLKKGKVTVTTGRMVNDNPDNFKITTPSATIGVRGCLFDLNQEEEDRLVINVIEVGKTNQPCIFVTTIGGVKYVFSAPGAITIEGNQIIPLPTPGLQPMPGLIPSLNANIPVNTAPIKDVIQHDKIQVPTTPKPDHQGPNHPPFIP